MKYGPFLEWVGGYPNAITTHFQSYTFLHIFQFERDSTEDPKIQRLKQQIPWIFFSKTSDRYEIQGMNPENHWIQKGILKKMMLTLVFINHYRYGTSTSEFDDFAGLTAWGFAVQFFKHPICHKFISVTTTHTKSKPMKHHMEIYEFVELDPVAKTHSFISVNLWSKPMKNHMDHIGWSFQGLPGWTGGQINQISQLWPPKQSQLWSGRMIWNDWIGEILSP